ncbi:protein pex26 [Aspergillus mulundensis]|uniref:Microbody (Peroxisome) proliferation protein peroxin 26 n=1 Tax=Aspergillus mulundensis TaxID=1810919 RepID=A0A3D8RYQ7_9EURO|nr:Microbody (Peroxisome) proliferation protein peroxin 26 [Aspergillus mulundensis]RDW79166.1 Microbody (Peroxisome) proliferation protein peroxin 26 [Aspergillus mulundensis]
MADDASGMSASTPALSPSKLCSRTYKKASQLFLTRRLQEALVSIEPVITAKSGNDDPEANGTSLPPIATVPATWRIKIWNLYITLLSAIIDLGPEEGKKTIGQKEWKDVSTQVRDGSIWEKVVQMGYQGREGSIDAEVVYNLGTLLLNHSPSQTVNQQRLETYLSSYGQPNLDIEEHLNSPTSSQRHHIRNGGTDTPKDLAARVRLIELFTLHVLPRNEEWDYAQEFISLSEVLDEERKEVFLQTLDGLKEEKEQGKLRAAALQREKDAELERQMQEAERQKAEEAAAAERAAQTKSHKRSGSEVDYGIEKNHPTGSLRGKKGEKAGSSKAGSSSRTALSPPNSKNLKKPEKPETRARQSQALATVLRNLVQYLGNSISKNPLSFLRSVLFLLGIVFALNRPNVRERIKRIVGSGWQKVRGTVGMGVKVSYI